MALLTELLAWGATSHLRYGSLCEELVATIPARNLGNDKSKRGALHTLRASRLRLYGAVFSAGTG